jgi:hypothetical protein
VFYAERGRNIASIARQLQKAVAAREEEKKKRRRDGRAFRPAQVNTARLKRRTEDQVSNHRATAQEECSSQDPHATGSRSLPAHIFKIENDKNQYAQIVTTQCSVLRLMEKNPVQIVFQGTL